MKAIFIAGIWRGTGGEFNVRPADAGGRTARIARPAPMAPEDLGVIQFRAAGHQTSACRQSAIHPLNPIGRRARALGRPGVRRRHLSANQGNAAQLCRTQVRGGRPAIPADTKLAPGASGPEVALLRKRLVISDDLAPELEAGDSYDAALVDAVKHFQLRHGLEANGSIGPQTLRALNVPVAARIKQLEASLERLLGMDFVSCRTLRASWTIPGGLRRGGCPRQGRTALSRHRRQGRHGGVPES